MQIIKSLRIFLILFVPVLVFSQSSHIPLGSKDYNLVDRLEIMSGDPELMFSTIKPLSRRRTVSAIEKLDSASRAGAAGSVKLSAVDQYDINSMLVRNMEWSTPRESFKSKKSLGKYFYTSPADLYQVNTKDFFLSVNPVIQYQQMFESNNNQNLFLNSRGFAIRGLIAKKVAFDIYLTDNQERDPAYVQQWITSNSAVPGARFYKNFKAAGGYDYFDNRASISFNATKYIDIQFGYDRNFIGDGFRSLLMSNFSGNALFLKFNTRIWKLNYENLFMELIPLQRRASGNSLLSRKYYRMNQLSFNATKWLNVGVFDAVTFGRRDHFDFQYLVPVLFLRPAESDIGSADNALVGLNFKANIKKKVQVYGQLALDEFKLSEVFKSTGYWANKFGYQLGIKYPEAFGLPNLDLQLETNRIRPFTYSHFDSLADYSHYNQPLAHPLGASIQEFVGIVRYRPMKKVYLEAKAIYFKQGLDSLGQNYGGNIFRDYNTRTRTYGYYVGSGNQVKVMNLNFYASYELREGLFIDAAAQHRINDVQIGGKTSTTVMSVGFRLNSVRRVFDF